MIYRVYVVLDKAVQAFNQPLIFRSEGEALRAFMEAVLTEGTQFNKHKRDYTFCFAGTFNDSTGMVSSEPPVPIAEASTVESLDLNVER
ncbi:MAG: nonstructural protein [Microvirus sp.]|nr:MAG: nonstructural protein [Microvirus sp.]